MFLNSFQFWREFKHPVRELGFFMLHHKLIKHLVIGVNEEVSRSISNSPNNRILRWCRGRRGRSGMDGKALPKIVQIARAILSAGIAELQSAQAHRCGNPIVSHTQTQSWAGGTETLTELADWPQPTCATTAVLFLESK